MLGILVSRADDASTHIGNQLREIADWTEHTDDSRPDAAGGGTVYRTAGAELREFEELHLHLDRPADAFDDIDVLVFASKHAGETGQLLTAHHTGNFGPADHGGEDNAVARACPNAHAHVLDALETHAPEGYDVGMEGTHHGPTDVGAPSMFVEVGSSQAEWDDPDAARAAAQAILDCRGVSPDRDPENGGGDAHRRHLLGIGGGHYAPRFERVVRETDWAVGHIAADWGLDAIGDLESATSQAVLSAAFEESRAAYALVDGDRPDVTAAVERAGGRVVGETWVRETDGVPLGLVDRVETAVATVADGLRFGEAATGYDGDFVVIDLPPELLDEARGIDREATYELLEAQALAFGTDQGGTRPTNPVVLADETDREDVVDGLRAVLEQRYDSVERENGELVARERAFSAEKARTLGVPEGPKFGKLSSGQSVEVDGETIPPEAVSDSRERRFRLE
ncbi:D-aminoacyl-tRNA deacylase [Salinibaculum rarum]|uniref:D-aminoacyl-tRNA deacylase n=1 Tax=Salinibaculum rarum TaxID=3058903 RepID=UPI00265EC56C|nr:D-aminoacyl-tRNA deacylase [Salinibaculum sp. KK48]